MIQSYQDRNVLLKEIGYSTYQDYLDSTLWDTIRTRVHQQKGRACILCPKAASCVHHREYSKRVLLGKDLTPLVPLCEGCHRYIEFNKDGSKIPLHRVESKFTRRFDKVRKEMIKLGRLRKCMVCGLSPQKGTRYCRTHNPGIVVEGSNRPEGIDKYAMQKLGRLRRKEKKKAKKQQTPAG